MTNGICASIYVHKNITRKHIFPSFYVHFTTISFRLYGSFLLDVELSTPVPNVEAETRQYWRDLRHNNCFLPMILSGPTSNMKRRTRPLFNLKSKFYVGEQLFFVGELALILLDAIVNLKSTTF